MARRLPASIVKFVNAQPTLSLANMLEDPWKPRAKRPFPFEEYIYPMVASVLLSGRISAISKNLPNKTDSERWCKASNFNPFLFEWLGAFLVHSNILEREGGAFKPGRNVRALQHRDLDACRRAFFAAFAAEIDARTPRGVYRSHFSQQAGFEGYLRSFASAFKGKAIPADRLGSLVLAFSELPKKDLEKASGIDSAMGSLVASSQWFDATGQDAFEKAMAATGGFEHESDGDDRQWLHVSGELEVILEVASAVKAPTNQEFSVHDDLTVRASCHHALDTLASLHRFANVAHKDETLTFQLDPVAIKEAAVQRALLPRFKGLLESFQPQLPPTVERLLTGGNTDRELGTVHAHLCQALIGPGSPKLLNAIRQHRKLKNYLAAGAPPGYLLIKAQSDPWNFLERCRECGFELKVYQ